MLPPILYVVQLPGGTVLPIFTYGFARGVAVIIGLLIWRFGFKHRGIDPDHAYMAFLWVAPITLITASSFGLGRVVAQVQAGGAPFVCFVQPGMFPDERLLRVKARQLRRERQTVCVGRLTLQGQATELEAAPQPSLEAAIAALALVGGRATDRELLRGGVEAPQ